MNNKKEISPFKERILMFIDHLGIGQGTFEKETQLSNGTINNIRISLKLPSIDKIIRRYPQLDKSWLITGKGDMILSENNEEGSFMIPLFDDVVTMGGTKDKAIEGAQHHNGYIAAGGWFKGATAALRHYGDSMKEYPSGCILALRELKEHDFVWGQNYVIEYGEDHNRITKRIQKGNNPEVIMACSTNEETYNGGKLIHEPKEIEITRLKRSFLVLGVVVKEHSVSGIIPVVG